MSNEVIQLSEQDRELIFDCLNRGEPLPQRFRLSLFADAPEAELVWSGKTSQIERTTLPFQSIEQVDEPAPRRMISWTFSRSITQVAGR